MENKIVWRKITLGQGLGGACCGINNNENEWHADSEWIFMFDQDHN